MSFFGVANPRPPVLRPRAHGVPGTNASGHMLKPKASTSRVRVTDLNTKRIIAYFDLTLENGSVMKPEYVCTRLTKIVEQKKLAAEVAVVHVVLIKSGQHYREVYNPHEADNCIVANVVPGRHDLFIDEKSYILGQDDYFYRLVEDPALQAPIKRFTPFWEAKETLLA